MTRVLIVDDKPENLYYLRALLEANAFEVDEARHGAEALAKARLHRPDVVVSDLLMPVMDGYTLLRHWKADARLAAIPFIVHTATYTEAEDERLAIGMGADAFILKPAEPDDFLARLRAVQANEAASHPSLPRQSSGEEGELLEVYSQTLIRKLEEKTLQLEESNRRLQLDIEARLVAQATLRESELWFRQLAENINEVFWITESTDERLLYVSPAYERIWGRPVESLHASPRSWLEVVHPEDRSRVESALGRQLHGEYDEVYRIVRPSGEVRWIHDRGFPVHDDHGVTYRVVGTAEDITAQWEVRATLERSVGEQRELARQLEKERARLVMAQQVARIGSWETRLDTLEVSWSAETFRIFETTEESFSPTHAGFLALVHPDDRAGVEAAFRASFDYQEPRTLEHRIVTPAGRVKQVEERWVISASDGHYSAVGTCQDITERLLLQERLGASQRLESVGQLTGGVAHDFNNLLTVILGNAEVLQEQLNGDPALGPLAQMVVEAAARGGKLVQSLLAFARKQPLDPRVVDVNALISGLDPLLRRAVGEHIDIRFTPAGNLWRTCVDPVQLESALLNLALNARDAMLEGGRLTVETTNAQLDAAYVETHGFAVGGPYVMVAVSDAGTGIPKELLQRVFEPFFSTKEKGKGTGLGLAMIYGFVKQSGGCVNIYSEPGVGTTVKLYFPRAGDEAAQDATAPAVPAQVPRGCESILLVEDDALVRQFAHGLLVGLGYQVVQAADGAQALAVLGGATPIDLLFTDVVMPGIGGRQLVDAARQLRPGLKVLYTSGYTEDAIVHHGRLDAGALLLGKPYRRAELAGKVRDALL